MSCYFLLYGRVSEPYVYIYLLFFGFPSHVGYHRAPSRVPCAVEEALVSSLFIHGDVCMKVPISQFIALPLPPT